MKYGLSIFVTEESITPRELAVEAEARGFESISFAEHSHMDTFRSMAEGAGRDVSMMEVSVYGAPPVPQELERYERAGISRVIFFVPPVGGRDGALQALDRYAELREKVGA
jgi:hypothetical protein